MTRQPKKSMTESELLNDKTKNEASEAAMLLWRETRAIIHSVYERYCPHRRGR